MGGGVSPRPQEVAMARTPENQSGHLDICIYCPECGRTFQTLYRSRKPVYCSDACKQRAYRRRRKQRILMQHLQEGNVTQKEAEAVTNVSREEIEMALGRRLVPMRCWCMRLIFVPGDDADQIYCDRCGGRFFRDYAKM